MPFRPNVHDELTLNGVTYRIAEHPAAPGIPYGQEGRAGIVYQLLPSPTGRGAGDEGAMALKVFRARFRTPALVSQAEKLAAFADLPGLTVCRRTVLTPTRYADLLRREPDLTYAVLMPWIEGPTWTEVMLEKRPLTPQQALDLARAFADIVSRMEQNGIAHCDLSGPNVLLPMLAQQTAYRPPSTVELVDVEGLYAPGLPRPEALPSGSSGYAHRTACEGLWGPTADRFAGAVLLAEMLCWGDESVRQACYGETYFDPAEMPAQGGANPPRYQTLLSALARHYGQPVADLFERAWTSETLADCPTFGEWLVALPEHPVAQAFSLSTPAAETTAGEQPTSPQESAAVDATAEIRAFMQAARRMEDKGNLENALELYRQALELAGADPSLRSLAREIELTVQDVEKRIAAQARRPQPAISPLPLGASFREDKGPGVRADTPLPSGEGEGLRAEGSGVRAEPRRKPGWDFWLLWVLVNILGMFVVNDLLFRVTRGSIRISYGIQTIVGRGIVEWWSSGLPLVGIAIGIAQWIVLHSYVGKKSWWWILTTISGWVAGLFFLGMLPHYTIWSMEPVIAQALGGAAIGIFLGLAQWLFLRRQVQRALFWILVNVVSWASGFILHLYFALPQDVMGFIVVGTIVGVSQWLALRKLISNTSRLVLANVLAWGGIGILEWIVLETTSSYSITSNGVIIKDLSSISVKRMGMAYEVGGLIGLFVIGTVIGLAQWLVFRHHFKRAGWWWILVTALGWTVGYFVSWSLLEAIGWTTFERFKAGMTTALVMCGTVAGIVQWLLLRRETSKAAWWIVANLTGWIASVVVILILGGKVILGLADQVFNLGWVSIIIHLRTQSVVLGAAVCILTGAVLVWLLRQPRREDERKSQPE
jgi:hypothetical protein